VQRHEGKVESNDSWPQLQRIDPAPGYGILDSLDDVLGRCTSQGTLHAKEVGIKDRGEDNLIDEHFDSNAAPSTGVIE